jgi:hypothetical protein
LQYIEIIRVAADAAGLPKNKEDTELPMPTAAKVQRSSYQEEESM